MISRRQEFLYFSLSIDMKSSHESWVKSMEEYANHLQWSNVQCALYDSDIKQEKVARAVAAAVEEGVLPVWRVPVDKDHRVPWYELVTPWTNQTSAQSLPTLKRLCQTFNHPMTKKEYVHYFKHSFYTLSSSSSSKGFIKI